MIVVRFIKYFMFIGKCDLNSTLIGCNGNINVIDFDPNVNIIA